MQHVKVTKTETYKDSQGDHTVCKGKLVLIIPEHKTGDEGYFRFYNGVYFKPIIISEIEIILAKDKVYDVDNKQIKEAGIDEKYILNENFKVLSLPENFSPKHIQAIIDGKLKDGDEVFVECEKQIISACTCDTMEKGSGCHFKTYDGIDYNCLKRFENNDYWKQWNEIKLTINHIKLFPVNKKEDTVSELKWALNTLFDNYNAGTTLSQDNYSKIEQLTKKI